jgi:hypothetical protein
VSPFLPPKSVHPFLVVQVPSIHHIIVHLARESADDLGSDYPCVSLLHYTHKPNSFPEQGNSLCSATTLKINTSDSVRTTTGSTFRPGDSSVYRRSIVLLEPPAPAARVLLGRTLAIFSFWSAAARRRMAVLGPPGAAGEEGRLMLAPDATGAPVGEEARGEDCIWARR